MTTFKKTLAFTLSLALLLTSLVVPMVISAEAEKVEIWDGSVATSFAGGTGTEADPYIIKNGAQLAFAIQYNTADNAKYNKHFVLANDIYLNDITKINWETGEIEEGYELREWIHSKCSDGNSGWFHGNGGAVYGLYINEPDNGGTTRVGLVPLTWNGVKFYDFGMDYTYINTNGPASFFIGYGKNTGATYSEFENCWVGANSTLISKTAASGFAYGQFKYITFKDCYSLAKLSSPVEGVKVGALAGDVWGPSTFWLKNCYGLGALALNFNPTFTNCYSTAQSADGLAMVDAANMQGTKAQTNMTMLGADFAVTEGYPVFKTQRDADVKLWGGFLSKPATSDGKYVINNPEEMAWYAKNGGSAVLTTDLYLNDLKVTVTDQTPVLTNSDNAVIDPADNNLLEWFGTGTALGAAAANTYNFDGAGHVIYGLYHNHGELAKGANYAGIFNSINGGTSIYGVGIEDAYMVVNAQWSAAFLVGRENSITYTIDSCYAGENTYYKGYDTAALVGGGGKPSSPATIKNCYVLSTLIGSHGDSYTNAFTGDNWDSACANYYNCYTTHNRAYRYGVSKEAVYVGMKLSEISGRGAQVKMTNLGDAFVVTDKYPVLKVFTEDKGEYWGGFASKPTSGDGSAEAPFMLETGENLAWAITHSAADTYYKLANDIYLNDLSKINWTDGSCSEGYQPRSWYDDVNVQGNFEGDGHMVYGLYRSNGRSTSWGIGGTALFPKIANTASLNIHGIGIDYAYICGWHGGGGFVGNGPNDNTIDSYLTIDESFVGQNVYIQGYDAGAAVGDNRGIHTVVTNFYSLAKLNAVSCKGLATDLWGGSITVKNSYNGNGPVDSKGGANCTNVYATEKGGSGAAVLAAEQMQGEASKLTMFGLGDKFVATATFPVLKLFAENYDENNLLGNAPFIGSGTEADPYLIITATDLYNMVALGGQGAYYKLANDVYVNDVNAVDWLTGAVNEGYTPTEWFMGFHVDGSGYRSYVAEYTTFCGTIDGNGYAVHGIYYPLGNKSTVAGFIPRAENTTIKNLGIEDSFIGGGRFTGGFIGISPNTANTITVTECYIDDSCTVMGWDAGAAYVSSDSHIGTGNDGGKLCMGTVAYYTYKEAADGTYKYDAENDKYVAIAEDEEYDGTRYAVDDVVWGNNVHFTSNALGGIIARLGSTSTVNIENCYVTANVRSNNLRIFGSSSQGVTFAAENASGAGIGHSGGLWGDDWNATTNASNCFSIIAPHEHNVDTASNLYTLADTKGASQVKVSNAQGATALDEMTALDGNVWYAVKADGAYPALRLRGTVIGDVDENGIGAEFTDTAALRMTIIGANNNLNANFNRDTETNIFDLVALSLKADAKQTAEEEANAKLLFDVFVSDSGSNANDGSYEAPVKTLDKAYSMVKDCGYINVVDTLTVTSLPKGSKCAILCGGTIDMSSLDVVSFGSDTIINDCTLKFKDGATVYANGKDLVIESETKVEGIPAAIYGGGNYPVTKTYLDLRAGSYKKIYGGGNAGTVRGDAYLYLSHDVNADLTFAEAGDCYVYGGSNTGTVYGDTVVIIEGNVNAPLDHTSHTAIARFYGGSENGDVKGSTSVIISENAEFNYIYGGCKNGTVGGATYVNFSAKAMSIYGGSGTVTETNVTVNGGWVHQVFGGCEGSSMTGDTTVTINGGYIDRRIVGGCYNNANRDGLSMNYTSENYVTGTCTVTLRDEATYNLSGDDWGVTALSRHSTNHDGEVGILVFENEALQTKLKSKLGIRWVLGSLAPAADRQEIE